MARCVFATIVIGIWSATVVSYGTAADGGAGAATADDGPISSVPLDVPRGRSLPGDVDGQLLFVKPGHWTNVRFEARGGPTDFRGDASFRLLHDVGVVESLEGMTWESRRALVVPRRETRIFDGIVRTPPTAAAVETIDAPNPYAAWRLDVRLTDAGASGMNFESRWPVVALRNHQALLAVLTDRPTAYRFLSKLDVVAAPGHDGELASDAAHYRVATVAGEARAAVPDSLAAWTTTAVVVWDGFDPKTLSPTQGRALIDWVHWGGTLIVAGPGAPPPRDAGPLASVLPAEVGRTLALAREQTAPLGKEWTAPGSPPPATTHEWRGVELRPASASKVLIAAGDSKLPLVVERRAGRGRCVMTAFELTERDLIDWTSYDGFWNGCLLRRPSRYGAERAGSWTLGWTDRGSWYDPTRTSGLRMAVRDDGRDRPARRRGETSRQYAYDLRFGPGTAAWRNDGPIVEAAVRALRAEAAIVVPGVEFVVAAVAIYVLALVPLNWLVFRAFGRPERAWLATLPIAAAFAAGFVYLAELDIGFARSSHEIAVVELQPGYSRALVSRFLAVYNSLGTAYRIEAEAAAIATTLAGSAEPNDSTAGGPSVALIQDVGPSHDAEAAPAAISGFAVGSNSAALLRLEQVVDYGRIECVELADGTYRVTNRTGFDLTDVRISGRGAARFEHLPRDGSQTFRVEAAPPSRRSEPLHETMPVETLRRAAGDFAAGELRLTAVAAEQVAGLKLVPAPTQRRGLTLVVAHLEYDAPPPEHDLNARPESR